MKILWLSEAGYSLDLALSCVKQGHFVKAWIKESKWKKSYDGIIDKVDSWESSIDWCDFVVFDHTGMSNIWKLVKDKKPCFGGSVWADKLEKDREYAHQVFEQIGLKRFESLKVNKISEAIDHVKKHKVKHVVKPVGKQVDSHHLIISEDTNGEDAIDELEQYEAEKLQVDYLEIEEKKDGIEVGLDGYFNGKDWIGDIYINFEHKRYATGYPEGIGPLTGEMGNVGKYVSTDNKFFKNTLNKIKYLLAQNDYRGQINICFIVDQQGKAWPLEAGPRLGYPGCYVQLALQRTSIADLFYNIAIGRKIENSTSPDWAVGVVVLMPGYPSTERALELSNNRIIQNYSKNNPKQIHLVESKSSPKGPRTCPGQGYPLVVTGTGKTLPEAKSVAYRVLSSLNPNRIKIKNSFWRVDISDRVMRQIQDIEKFGIIQQNKQPKINILSILLS